jgi:hypoxanthine phosphoribosyltransferase
MSETPTPRPKAPASPARAPDGETIDVIFSAAQIAARVEALAGEIKARGHDDLLVVAVLKGSFVFAADLIRAMHRVGLAPEIDFLTLSSYGQGTASVGRVTIVRDLETDVAGRNVLVIDDILESGRTLAFAKDLFVARGARTVSTCVLLEKPERRAVAVQADFKAFDCPPDFVVGYGMDVAHRYRELPYVGRLLRT